MPDLAGKKMKQITDSHPLQVKPFVIALCQLLVRHETSKKKGENRLRLSAIIMGAS